MYIRKKLSLASAIASFVALGTTNAASAAQLLYGYDEAQNYYGAGVMNSFVTLDDDGTPLNVGWAFSEGVLDTSKLPAEEHSHGTEEHSSETFNLELPKDSLGKNYTALDHIGLGWNPEGHEPEFAYGAPHFDAHFFMISPEQRQQIPEAPDTGPFVPPPAPYQNPSPQFVAEGYVNSGHYVAEEGAHWVDESGAEFKGQQFTKSLVYGYDQNGSMHFVEPMITVDFLKSLQTQGGTTSTTDTIKLPEEFQKSGIYPTEYTVTYNPNATDYQYTVTLSGLTNKEATPVPEADSTFGLLALGSGVAVYRLRKLRLTQLPK